MTFRVASNMRQEMPARPASKQRWFPTGSIAQRTRTCGRSSGKLKPSVERGQQSLMRSGSTSNLRINHTGKGGVQLVYSSPATRCGTTTTVPSAS